MEAGSFIQTVSGRRFDPLAPDVAEIDIMDIAIALSHQCRFGGHCRAFYSVAQHSCLVADLVAQRTDDPETCLAALLHDASEAYLVDLPHPLKHRSELGKLYAAAEKGLERAIGERFRLDGSQAALIKEVDRRLLATERRELALVAWEWPELQGIEPLDLTIETWASVQARDELLERFARFESQR